MRREPISFPSAGARLDGDLSLPDGLAGGERRPALVVCSGYQGLKDMHPARFARTLVPAGYVCLGFDYRGFGRSDGPPGRLHPEEQVEDVRAAIDFLETVAEVDPARIALLGWALGGGIVIAAAADDPRVRSVVAVNAIGDGERSTRSMHDEQSWDRLGERIAADRAARGAPGASELVPPFEIVRLDRVTRGYVVDELARYPGFGTQVTLESAELLLSFRPEDVVARLAPRPLLLVHGAENDLHSPDESRELYRRAGEPKELVLLAGCGHTEWMYDDHPEFRRLVSLVSRFLEDALPPLAQSAA
ncbi:MAG: alpha/beta hydrolase [Gaiellaceae bacterium]